MGHQVDVLLIGYEEGENLGLRYIASYLEQEGIRVGILPFKESGQEEMLREVQRASPRIVGFSLIFQRMLYRFGELIEYFRKQGVEAHFTMGGHFPSIESQRVLQEIPGLDSVVRGEGELTMLDLVRSLDQPGGLLPLKGITFRENGRIVYNEPRPMLEELDLLPFPVRQKKPRIHRGVGVGTILGSRGCYYNCSFCSIRQFYSESPGAYRRSRSPGNLVEEMAVMYKQQGIRVFIFEDDDFLTRNRSQRKWIREFVAELKKSGFSHDILWRISSRVDDLEEDLIVAMKEVGLMCIYLGIESGNEEGLEIYNKHYSVKDIKVALALLDRLDVPFEFGFMILNPASNTRTIRQDIEFLKEINNYKQAVFQFTKMVPYAGTPIAGDLQAEGRLTGGIEAPDYSYLDPRVDLLQVFFSQAFHERNFGHTGIVEMFRYAKFDALVAQKFQARQLDTGAYLNGVRELIFESNAECLEKMSMALYYMERFNPDEILLRWDYLHRLAWEEKEAEGRLSRAMSHLMQRYILQ